VWLYLIINGKQFTEYTLRKLYYSLELSELNYEIILVNDNPSESVEYLKEKYPDLIITNNERNIGIAASRNIGKKLANTIISILLTKMIG